MYDPPVYVQLVVPMLFDAQEAQRRREIYEGKRRDHTCLWRQSEIDHNPHYYQRADTAA